MSGVDEEFTLLGSRDNASHTVELVREVQKGVDVKGHLPTHCNVPTSLASAHCKESRQGGTQVFYAPRA